MSANGDNSPGSRKSYKSILHPTELTDPEELGEEKQITPQPRRGGKPLSQQKPKGAYRQLYEKPLKVKVDRIRTIYKERVVDHESGEDGLVLWYHTENSKTIGREEIVRFNPKTEEEFTLGYDYTIPYSKQKVAELMKLCRATTVFVQKDGEDSFTVPNPKENF